MPAFLAALLPVGWRLSGGKVRACLKALEVILRRQAERGEAGLEGVVLDPRMRAWRTLAKLKLPRPEAGR
jgi:hypothetical protein